MLATVEGAKGFPLVETKPCAARRAETSRNVWPRIERAGKKTDGTQSLRRGGKLADGGEGAALEVFLGFEFVKIERWLAGFEVRKLDYTQPARSRCWQSKAIKPRSTSSIVQRPRRPPPSFSTT
jgi:hypothetical protein